MMPAIRNERLRALLVADIQQRADAWKLEGAKAWNDEDARVCRLRAGVLEMLITDLEEAAARPLLRRVS